MPDKLQMMSKDIIQENIDYIAKRFPNALKEVKEENGKLVNLIDFDVLKQELSNVVIDDKQERYQMTWPDKKRSILLANSKINGTLRPVKEKSIDFDNTKNIYIEGDNLDVLKLLRETYLGKVKMIYIDPPYNTGNDFIYEDDFSKSSEEYLSNSGQYDDQGNRLVENTEANGRFHTDWLNMMYPRIKVSRDLLSNDGVIFISIDDREIDNLKKICDEIFGTDNFVACIIWQRAYAPVNMNKWFSPNHDYCLVYAKSINEFDLTKLPRTDKQNADYQNPDNDPRGPWKAGNPSVGPAVKKNIYEITLPSGRKVLPPAGRSWLYSKEKYDEMVADNRVYFGKDGNSVWAPKMFLSEVSQGVTPMTLWTYSEVGHSQDATKELKKLFDDTSVFDYSKPVEYIKRMIHLGTKKNGKNIVLDFFSGSATTAHAVMKINCEDGGNRRFIMVQLPEFINKKIDNSSFDFDTICDIGEERIRRAGKKILEEYNKTNKGEGLFASENNDCKLDIGFRVLKLDSSNMNDVYYSANSTTQSLFENTVDNVKSDRTSLDLLFQVMLELGIELSAKIEEKEISGKKYFVVNENDIVACFDSNVNNDVIKELAQIKPIYAVFRDSVFENDAANINCEQLFKSISPSTTIKVL